MVRKLMLVLLLATLTACSSGGTNGPDAIAPTDDGGRSRADERSPDEGKQSEREQDGKGSKGGGEGQPDGSGPGDSEGSGSGSGGTDLGDSGSSNGSTASVELTDGIGDTESSEDPPAYTDIVAAGVEGSSQTLRLTITVNDPVPRRMPDADTFFSVDTTIDGEGKPYNVYADGTANGWTAYVSHNEGSRKLQNAFRIDGSTTVIEIPWSVIGGQRRFRWSAATSWTRSTLTRTYYSFDEASRGNGARYPGG
jgi:hypothetical protein